jgi:hypothetical protein
MAEPDFLVTLPSNSNMRTHPSNEPANYTVKLASPINLTGDWEVALVSLQYTPSWLNICKSIALHIVVFPGEYDSCNISKQSDDPGMTELKAAAVFRSHENNRTLEGMIAKVPAGGTLKEAQILAGYYESPEVLGKEFCRIVEAACTAEKIKLTYLFDRNTQTGSFMVLGGVTFIAAEEVNTLNEMLGTDRYSITSMRQSCAKLPCNNDDECADPGTRVFRHYFRIFHQGNIPAKIKKVDSLWVYTNISSYQHVGDTKAPLLSIIPANGEISRRTHYTVNPVNYLPVTRDSIPEIQIRIVDDKGERIPLSAKSENVVCCLRFRRRKTPLPI